MIVKDNNTVVLSWKEYGQLLELILVIVGTGKFYPEYFTDNMANFANKVINSNRQG